MHFKLVILLALCALLSTAQEPEIIDFTYTQLLEQANYIGRPRDAILIAPDTKQLEKYQFPEVCDLQKNLQEGADSSGTVDNFINMDDYLETLRAKVLNLLKLAEEIKNSRSYLAEISKHLEMNEEQSILNKFEIQLLSLAKKESQLLASRLKIQSLTKQLNQKIEDYNNNPKNQQFKSVSLNYEIQNYISKLSYLRDLKERSQSKAASRDQNNFTDFYRGLGFDLSTESEHIESIDRYFQNMSHLNYLKDTANSLRDNIEVDRLNIQYKKSCEKKKQEKMGKASDPHEIKETLDHLREKKKEFGNKTNKYCEGVALKLQMQIKRLLRAMNWTFMCADGLEDLIRRRELQINQLEEIQDKIKAFGAEGVHGYNDEYEAIKNRINKKFSRITTFTIDQYTHDPISIDFLIAQAERGKADAEQKQKSIPQQMNNDEAYSGIKILAEEIKKEKAKFCHNYRPYESEQRKMWFRIYSQEQQQVFSSKMRGQFISESRTLQRLQIEYKEQSEVAADSIVSHYEPK